jgi:hypothetical protein
LDLNASREIGNGSLRLKARDFRAWIMVGGQWGILSCENFSHFYALGFNWVLFVAENPKFEIRKLKGAT